MLIPPINSKGYFEFGEPFQSKLNPGGLKVSYRVIGIRSLNEIASSGLEPFKNIYQLYGLDKDSYIDDVNSNMPIVTLTRNGHDYHYVPASYIKSQPISNGYLYKEYTLGINLGILPNTSNMTTVLSRLSDDIVCVVKDALRRDVNCIIFPTSADIYFEDDDNTRALKLLGSEDNKPLVYKSYKTKYNEAIAIINEKNKYIEELERELMSKI